MAPAESGSREIGVLGQIFARTTAETGEITPLALGGPKQQAVLAVLIANRPQVISADSLALAVYGDDAPERGRRRVQTYVSTLRSVLGDAIVRSGDGWRFDQTVCTVDIDEFERLGRTAKGHRSDEAAAILADALALWRGDPYAGVEAHGRLDGEIARLQAMRIKFLDSRVESELAAGRDGELVGELEALMAENPYNERFRAHHMLALYRSGRQEEALKSFQELRATLVEQVGVTPSPELTVLERRILEQDSTLAELPSPDEIPLRGYRLLEKLRRDQHSTVWRAIQPSISREVTIRHIDSELSAKPQFIRSFEARAQSAARVGHPHLVTLIDYWRDPDGAYLVTRWHNGGTLASALEDATFNPSRSVELINQIGSALAAAHRASFSHGHLDASSILFDDAGNAFLDLFGADPVVAMGATFDGPAQRGDVEALARLALRCLSGTESSAEEARARMVDKGEAPELIDAIDRVFEGAASETVEDLLASLGPTATGGQGDPVPDLRDLSNPYKGLRAFEESDARDFFGRSVLIDEMLTRLAGTDTPSRVLTVIGSSGSGKSSLVQAGLVPALRNGGVAGSADWFITTMTPGPNPFAALDEALGRIATTYAVTPTAQANIGDLVVSVADGRQVLVVIDQFEELFSQSSPHDMGRFLTELSLAAWSPSSNLRVVATLRADHYGEPLSHPDFAPIFTAGTLDVTPLGADDLIDVVVKPAEQRGLRFADGLVARIVADSVRQSTPLPLLQYTLAEMVERRDGATLTIAAYDSIGGVAGAIRARAELLYLESDEAHRAAVRRVFARLVNTDASVIDLRRWALLADFADDAIAREVMSRYGAARLLSFGHDPASREPTVEVAHEALLREWPRAVEWLHQDRALIQSVDRLAAAADAWHEGGGEEADLYRDTRLAAARSVRDDAPERLRVTDRAFLEASTELADRIRQTEGRRLQRLRRLLAAAVVCLLLAVTAGLVARTQQQRANKRATEATARGLAAASGLLAAQQLDTALLLAANASGVDPSPATVGGLLNVLEQARHLESFSQPARGEHEELRVFGAISLAVDTVANTVRLFDTVTGEPIASPIEIGSDVAPLFRVDLSSDSSTLAVSTETEISIWSVDDGRRLAGELPSWSPQPPEVRLSPSGTYLATAHPRLDYVEVFRTADGTSIGTIPNRRVEFFAPTFSPTEDRLISVSARDGDWLTVYSVPGLEPIGDPTQLQFPANVALLSPDESLIAVAVESPEAAVTLLDARTHEQVSPTLSLEGDRLADLAWSPDSARVAMASLGGEVLIIDAQARTIEAQLSGHAGFRPSIAFIDRDRLAVMVEGTQVVWDLGREPAPSTPFGARAVDIRPDGTSVALVGLKLEVTAPGGTPRSLPLGEAAWGCYAVRASPFGNHAVLLCDNWQNSQGLVIDLSSGPIHEGRFALTPGFAAEAGLWDASLSPDGGQLAVVGQAVTATGEQRGFVGTLDSETGAAMEFSQELDVWVTAAVEWTPDGSTILAGGQLGDLFFLDPATLAVTDSIPTSPLAAIMDISFDSEGRIAVVANEQGEVWLIDIARREAVGQPFTGSASQFQGAAISPDGTRVAAIGRDSYLRIWDAETATLLTSPLGGAGSETGFGEGKVRFVGNDRLVTFDDGPPLIWDLDAEHLAEIACQLAGRTLTDAERAAHAPDLSSDDVCAN